MQRKRLRFLTEGAMIAALYVLLTWISASVGLSGGAVQFRFSEILTVLPIFTPAAVPGLFFGCLIANLLPAAAVYDILFGSIATLLGAIGTRLLRRQPILALLPPILANTAVIPFVILLVYLEEWSLPLFLVTALGVGIGEILSAGVLGYALYRFLRPYAVYLFRAEKQKKENSDV